MISLVLLGVLELSIFCLPNAYQDASRISKRSVDALTCPSGRDREFLWDSAIVGFGVAAFPSGKKVYVVQYRQDGRSRRSSIGEHGRLTPEQARSEAKKLLGVAESGSDPIAARKAAREVRTFGVYVFNSTSAWGKLKSLDPCESTHPGLAYFRNKPTLRGVLVFFEEASSRQ